MMIIHPTRDDVERELARRKLLYFITYTMRDYEVNWHHKVICNELDTFLENGVSRLILCMPPRHGKSQIVSRHLPAYLLGKNPETRIIACSYSSDLAEAMNRDVQRIIDDPKYTSIFPRTKLSGMSDRSGRGNALRNSGIFEVVGHRGMYLSSGVGGSITGRGFDIGIIDDPIKNREEADSTTYRERLWDWYRSTFYTRREKDAKILIITTRWHEEDLVGKLLQLQKDDPKADRWKVISFPALFEGRGEYTHESDHREIDTPLWPTKYSMDDLTRIKASLGSYEWAGLYQQRPAPEGGGIFHSSWWNLYERLPAKFEEMLQSWDMTFDNAENADFVVGQVWGRVGEQYYLVDQVRDRMDFTQTIRAVKNLTLKWPAAKLKLVEDKANGPAVISMLKKEIAGLVPVEPMGSKEARAHAVSPIVESGNVFIPARAPWLDDFLHELNNFPNARNDDQCDALTQALSRFLKKSTGWSYGPAMRY